MTHGHAGCEGEFRAFFRGRLEDQHPNRRPDLGRVGPLASAAADSDHGEFENRMQSTDLLKLR